jgi:cobalt-zinc-cadmium efflux system outer membrane protein
MKKMLSCLVSFAVLLPAASLHAQARSYAGAPLTLAEALDDALARNVDIVALRRQLDMLRLRPAQERSLPPPMLETQIWQWPVNSLNPWKANSYMPMATQELPGRGKRQIRAALAEKDVELGQTDVVRQERGVIDLVKQAYFDLFASRKAIDSNFSSVDILRQLADVSQAKYATGRMSQQDVLKAVVELSKLHEDIIALDEHAQIASVRLNTLLNRPIDTPIGPLDDPHEQVLVASIDQLQDAALANQPELTAARQQVEHAEAELAVAKQDYKPDFSIQAGYMLMPHQTDGLMAKVGMTWPRAPWSRGKLDLRVQEMTAQIEAARARQRAIESGVHLSVQDAFIRVKAAEQRAALLRTTILPQSQQTFDVSRVGYQTDQVDFLTILDNQRMALGFQLDYYNAIGDFEQALADLERAVGRDMTPSMLMAAPGTEEAK